LALVGEYELSAGWAVAELAFLLVASIEVVFWITRDTWAACTTTSRNSNGSGFALLGRADATWSCFGYFCTCNHDAENGWWHVGSQLQKLATSDLIVAE